MLAAVGAVVAALLELTIASRFQVADAQLHILLVFAVVITVTVGIEDGMAWAFAGGLTVDLLNYGHLGSTVFTLLIAVGAAAVLGRSIARGRVLGPLASVFVLTVFYALVWYMVSSVLQPPVAAPRFSALGEDALLNTLFACLIAPPFIAWRRRVDERERVVW